MKIYVVTHFYDNGESYEDYRGYEEHKLYSTYQLGLRAFYDSVESDYEGKFTLTEWELDTQERYLLEESAWVECKPYYNEEWQGDYEPEYNPEDYYPDPMDSYKEYWRWEDETSHDDISKEEDKAWLEYVITPGTNYHEWEECEEEIKKRKSDILFEELNNLLINL